MTKQQNKINNKISRRNQQKEILKNKTMKNKISEKKTSKYNTLKNNTLEKKILRIILHRKKLQSTTHKVQQTKYNTQRTTLQRKTKKIVNVL